MLVENIALHIPRLSTMSGPAGPASPFSRRRAAKAFTVGHGSLFLAFLNNAVRYIHHQKLSASDYSH